MTATAPSPLYRKIALRLVPFLMLLYMVAFLDRVNISFAALTMNRDLGISESLYGLAAGIFFLGYCVFEVPANLMLVRLGARRWIAILLVTWGVVSLGTAFVSGRGEYVSARFLLGVAESGFYPGIIFYLTLWLPRVERARRMALFMVAVPVSSCIGAPVSSHILLMDQLLGLRGWQWLFLVEGAPAVLLGVVTWFVLADGPAQARWLSAAERAELAHALQSDEGGGGARPAGMWLRVMRDSAAYFLYSVGLYGLSFWLPKMLVAGGSTATATGWWAAVPYGLGALSMMVVSRMRGRPWLPCAFLVSACGFAGAAVFHGLPGAVICLSLAAMGLLGALPLFWAAATGRMSAKAAGAAIAIINSVGAVGGFSGPAMMGWLHQVTHSYAAGLWAIAACVALGAGLTWNPGARREAAAR